MLERQDDKRLLGRIAGADELDIEACDLGWCVSVMAQNQPSRTFTTLLVF